MPTSFEAISEQTRELALLQPPREPRPQAPARGRTAAAVLLGLLGGFVAALVLLAA